MRRVLFSLSHYLLLFINFLLCPLFVSSGESGSIEKKKKIEEKKKRRRLAKGSS
jgi:hypothetical protein